MISLMTLIFMCLVFFTLYEQTYGSWVTFTDRMLTKDVMPSMVVRTGTPLPWSMVSLLLAPLSFVVAAWLSDRNPGSGAPKALFAGAFVLMLVLTLLELLFVVSIRG